MLRPFRLGAGDKLTDDVDSESLLSVLRFLLAAVLNAACTACSTSCSRSAMQAPSGMGVGVPSLASVMVWTARVAAVTTEVAPADLSLSPSVVWLERVAGAGGCCRVDRRCRLGRAGKSAAEDTKSADVLGRGVGILVERIPRPRAFLPTGQHWGGFTLDAVSGSLARGYKLHYTHMMRAIALLFIANYT